jgi:2-dehydro-3-deoxyglucarate aldolase
MNKHEIVNSIRNKLKNSKPSVGSWMQIPHPSIAEIMGSGNFDWIAVDMEHGSVSHFSLPDLFRAIELGGTLPLARISEGTMSNCKQSLDAGAGGLIIPMIESAKHLEECISWSMWPPAGKRGVGFSRANLYGKFFQEYNEFAQNPLIIAQIENKIAIENLEEILSVENLDAIMIGPYDLSASMGITADFENPTFLKVLDDIKKLCIKNKIPLGFHLVEPSREKLKEKIDEGFLFIAYSIDAVLLQKNLNWNN